MKIVHISADDTGGGAAIACIRHAEAMRAAGIDAQVVVTRQRSERPFVHCGVRRLGKLLHLLYQRAHDHFLRRARPVGTFSLMAFGHRFDRLPEVRNADVVFLHWVNANTLSVRGVEKILRLGKPVFWYLHDMFPITGGCHHSLGCEGYTKDCRDCPLVQGGCAKRLTARQFSRKLRRWSRYENLSFVTPSRWMAQNVERSRLAEGHRVFTVPNLLDTSVFKPMSVKPKELFGLDASKRTVLFCASSFTSVYKGFDALCACLKALDPEKYEGLIIGEYDEKLFPEVSIKIHSTGLLHDDLSMVLAYNASDTFVISSVAENYPNVVLEAMACGLPCVGYKVGGIPELIQDRQSGYVTTVNSPEELVNGVEYVLSDPALYAELSLAARKQVVQDNAYQNFRQIYQALF